MDDDEAAAMNEKEWLECTNPTPMIEFLNEKVSARKLRLIGVACCRHAGALLENDHKTLATAEDYADGIVGDEDLLYAWWDACEANDESRRLQEIRDSILGAALSVVWVDDACHLFDAVLDLCHAARLPVERILLVEVVQEIFGNPFRPVTINPAWLTWNDGTVVRIAQSIYDEKAFDRMPILADALTDAGCDNADILNHCRSDSPHVRGCWVVDLLLGKEMTTLTELAAKLSNSGVPNEAYSLNGGLPNEAYCIEKSDCKWHVYYSERGSRTDLKIFDSEQEVCNYFFQLVTGHP